MQDTECCAMVMQIQLSCLLARYQHTVEGCVLRFVVGMFEEVNTSNKQLEGGTELSSSRCRMLEQCGMSDVRVVQTVPVGLDEGASPWRRCLSHSLEDTAVPVLSFA